MHIRIEIQWTSEHLYSLRGQRVAVSRDYDAVLGYEGHAEAQIPQEEDELVHSTRARIVIRHRNLMVDHKVLARRGAAHREALCAGRRARL